MGRKATRLGCMFDSSNLVNVKDGYVDFLPSVNSVIVAGFANVENGAKSVHGRFWASNGNEELFPFRMSL